MAQALRSFLPVDMRQKIRAPSHTGPAADDIRDGHQLENRHGCCCRSRPQPPDIKSWKFCRVVVSDRGPGIPEDKLKEVFEPFFTSKPEGMGTRVPIIEAHEGLIWATNRDHGGASFKSEFLSRSQSIWIIQLPLRSQLELNLGVRKCASDAAHCQTRSKRLANECTIVLAQQSKDHR
jgi:hypothetical protein